MQLPGEHLAIAGLPPSHSALSWRLRRGTAHGTTMGATMMTLPRSPKKRRAPSTGPRPLKVQRASAMLTIDEPLPADARPVQASLEQLKLFAALMSEQGHVAHVSRLAYDRIYASERFGFAIRAGTGMPLPALARELMRVWRSTQISRAAPG
jgi:hypothetical protein